MWTSQKTVMPMIGAMISTNHEMPLAMESRVSPWKREACARDGSARIANATNGINHLLRGQRALAADCIAKCWVFISKADVVRAMAVFKFRPAATRSAGENLTVSAAKTYWTFVVRLQSRIRLKSNGLLGTESVTKSNGSTRQFDCTIPSINVSTLPLTAIGREAHDSP